MSARALFRVRTTSFSGAEPHENAAAWSEEIQLSSRSFPWGRRTWAQPSRIRRPRRGLGVWVAVRRGTLGWKLVGDTLLRSSGRGGRGGRKGYLGHQSVSWGTFNFYAQASAKVASGAPRSEHRTSLRPTRPPPLPREVFGGAFRPHLGVLRRAFRVLRRALRWCSRDKIDSIGLHLEDFFFGVGGSGRRPSRMCTFRE